MPILDHFGLLAPFYDRALPFRRLELFLDFARLPTEGKLLDAAGGTGRVGKSLEGYASQVVVVDLSSKMLQEASKKGGLKLVNSHTEKLPFKDEEFDRIVMVDALHHVCDQAETAAELWRILKPGGCLVIEEPDFREISVKVVALLEKIALMRSHFLDPTQIANLFPHKNSEKKIMHEGFNAWVIIAKQ
jgi:demethylmenaquinone methyltransferase/2-methoxy-6-polyprenyl-1,4-benzoquinol methylase